VAASVAVIRRPLPHADGAGVKAASASSPISPNQIPIRRQVRRRFVLELCSTHEDVAALDADIVDHMSFLMMRRTIR